VQISDHLEAFLNMILHQALMGFLDLVSHRIEPGPGYFFQLENFVRFAFLIFLFYFNLFFNLILILRFDFICLT